MLLQKHAETHDAKSDGERQPSKDLLAILDIAEGLGFELHSVPKAPGAFFAVGPGHGQEKTWAVFVWDDDERASVERAACAVAFALGYGKKSTFTAARDILKSIGVDRPATAAELERRTLREDKFANESAAP